MMLGKIVWFGGFNNQKNKVNNFGFIAPLGEENTGDIRVDRDDVPLDVQEIIEGNKGRGVYVQFDIDAKRNRVINLKVPTFIGVVKRYQFGGAWQITYNDNCKINFRSKTHYESESLVAFSIKETKDREAMEMAEIFGEDEEIKYKLAPFLLRTINDVREVDNDERIVEKYANSNIFPLFKKFIIEYLLSLPLEIAETFVINKLKDLNENQQDFIIKEIAEKLPNLLIISATLRSYLKFDSSSPNSYIEFINRQINLVEEHLRKELIDELIKKVEQAEENALNIYWQEVQYLQDNLAYKNFLWHIAPAERKIPIIAEYTSSIAKDVAEKVVLEHLNQFNQQEQDKLINELIRNAPKVILASSKLRSYLKFTEYYFKFQITDNNYGIFINKYLHIVDDELFNEIINELIERVEQAEEKERNIYWQQVQYLQDNLAYKNFIWHIAPTERKIPIIVTYTLSSTEDVAENVVLEHFNQFNQKEQDELINQLIKNAPKVILASSKLRSYLKLTEYDYNSYGILINQYLDSVDDDLFNEIVNELIERVEQVEEKERNIYWQQVQYLQDNLAYKNFIWHIAPTERKIPIIVTYTLSSTEDVAENVVLEHLNQFNQKEQDELINQLIKNAPKVILASSKLRSYLKLTEYDYNSYGIFINQYLDSVDDDLFNEIVNELIERVEQAKERERNIYWQQVKYLQNNLAYKNFLWHIAPTGKKQEIVQQRVKTFFDIISRFEDSNYPYEEYITHNWRELYQFNQSDNSLIREWDADVNFNDNKAAQMISARGAEKLVIRFYQALGYQVEDISIHQVTQKSKTWTLGDIRLDSQYLLDVKNSRKSVNSNSYSEFCVPQFKESRGNDVKIVGVLSPYLQKKYMQGRENPKFHVKNPQVLGAFDKAKLSELETIFSDRFISINMPRESDTNKYLPPWLFDYDQRYYKQQCEILIELQKLSDQDIPSWEDISVVAQNSIPLFVAAKRPLPQNWVNNLPQWQVNFINFLINLPIERITLPYLFLSILRHFLSMLSYRGGDYSPKRYLEVFYLSDKQIKPLKLYDPLNIIEDFCDTLQTLWDNRQASRLDEFKIFKFSGQGLLQGKRTESERILTTILAYCGGWVDGMGKCGFRPLVIGREQNCPGCGRLICPQDNCGFCSDRCSDYIERKKRKNK